MQGPLQRCRPYLAKLIVAILLALASAAPAGAGDTVATIRARGELRCGVADHVLGLADQDAEGRWRGIEPDFCRAVAAAVLEDPEKVRFLPQHASTRFPALLTNQIDLLLATTTWTLSREALLGVRFPAVLLFDGQTFMVPAQSAVREPADLAGTVICVEKNTTHSARLAAFMTREGMPPNLVIAESATAAADDFFAGKCAALSMESVQLAALRIRAGVAEDDYRILTTAISREPLAPVVRDDDPGWETIVRWVLFGLVLAEEAGIERASALATQLPSYAQAWGITDQEEFAIIAKSLELDVGWQLRAIHAVGNYGEIYDRNIGAGSLLRLDRGPNRPWNEGGLLYAPPLK